MNNQTCTNYIDEAKLEEMDKIKIEDLLKGTVADVKKKNGNLNLCRIQSVNKILVIHQFDAMFFYDENQQNEKSENKID